MSLSERVKLTYLGLAIIVLIAIASPAVLANQDFDDEFSNFEPPVTCLGLQPCAAQPDSAVTQVNGKAKRHRGGDSNKDKGGRSKGSVMAEQVLEQVYALPEADKRFLYGKLSEARGFAIFPAVRRSGVMATAAYGKGIIMFRDQSWEWRPPILLHMQGTSFGPQVVAQTSRIIFVFDKICDIRDFLSGHHHLVTGGSNSVMEHVGHSAPEPRSSGGGIKIYTVSNGVVMGQSLEGFTIHIDEVANAALYGVDFKPGCIVEGGRIGLQAPWFLKFMQNMKLAPGQPQSTSTVR
jgi:lipid-binding SYLF domain-containing protein